MSSRSVIGTVSLAGAKSWTGSEGEMWRIGPATSSSFSSVSFHGISCTFKERWNCTLWTNENSKGPHLNKESVRQNEYTINTHRSRWLKVSSNHYVHRNIMLIESKADKSAFVFKNLVFNSKSLILKCKMSCYSLVKAMYKYLYSKSEGFPCRERTLRECHTHSWMVWQNAGKGRWQSRRVFKRERLETPDHRKWRKTRNFCLRKRK